MKAISLFSGMGGDSLAIVNSGFELVAYSEWEKEMINTHKLNFPDTILLGNGDFLRLLMMNFPNIETLLI